MTTQSNSTPIDQFKYHMREATRIKRQMPSVARRRYAATMMKEQSKCDGFYSDAIGPVNAAFKSTIYAMSGNALFIMIVILFAAYQIFVVGYYENDAFSQEETKLGKIKIGWNYALKGFTISLIVSNFILSKLTSYKIGDMYMRMVCEQYK